jgi:nitroreductase/NAD-dependent dihydropyrimidine dehydrogenase PreA subunit
MAMPKITVDQNKCKRDGLCVLVCPEQVFEQSDKTKIPAIVRADICLSCGHCVAICPHGAIAHESVPSSRIRPIVQQKLPTPEQLEHLICVRRSVRAFKDTPVATEVIETILNGARRAPSANNRPTKYIVIQDRAVLARIRDLTAGYFKKNLRPLGNRIIQRLLLAFAKESMEDAIHLLPDFRMLVESAERGADPVLHNAPVLIIFHAKSSLSFAAVNANLALQNAWLVAQSLGVGALYTGYVQATCERDSRISKLLEIPRGHRVFASLAIGYPSVRFANWIEKEPLSVRWV